VQAELDDERAKLHLFDDELRALEDATRSKNSRIAEESLEMQKLGHLVEKFHKEQQGAAEKVARLEKEFDWISDEKDNFGRSGTPYDFKNHNIGECKSTLHNLTERFQGMKKKINPKVMNMIDSVEKKEVTLKQMIKTVIRDKRKIEETIVSLDDYKKKALQETWEKVNRDFGNIFAELLPGGSFAKLDPPEGKTISDGLEVKVCLGKVWKQSLTELSGGQRYVTLSLCVADKQILIIGLIGLWLPYLSSWLYCSSSLPPCTFLTRSMRRWISHIPRISAVSSRRVSRARSSSSSV
jgi:structural maintenance of chromosome 2